MKKTHTKLPASFRTNSPTPPSSMSRTSLALGISTVMSTAMLMPMLTPMSALAAEPAKDADTTLKAVKVQDKVIDPNPNAEPGVPYKARTSADQRHTRPLAETPQTIQVLTSEQIKDSGYTDLREILDAQPGITLGTGENGNAFGDRYIIRGQEARSDVFVDGLRDPGMTIRESFAVEQVEITKGPNSSFAGRGSAGGAINAVTKQATMDYNFARLSTGFGSDKHTRLTLDANQTLTDSVAVRANALYGYEEVPDRSPTDRERKGFALSGLFTPAENLDITLDYYTIRADDNYDMGSYLVGTVPNRNPAKNPLVYAQEADFLKSDVDTFTARINYAFNDDVRITNLTRYGETDNGYVVTGGGVANTGANNPGGVFQTVTLGTHQGWQEVESFANQTNLYIESELFGMKNEFIFGVEYTDQTVLNGVYSVTNSGQNCITGNGTTLNAWCVVDASGNTVNGINTIMNRQISKGAWDQDWSVETVSVYAMDTVDLTDQLSVFAGLRVDHFDYALKTQNTTTLVQTGDFNYSDDLYDGHLGLVYDINEYGNVYFSYGTATDINGGESDVGTNSGYGGLIILSGEIAGADPEKSELYELGTKWNLFDDRLLVTAALFQIEKSDVMEGNGYTATGTFNSAENRVRGIEIGAVGEIMDDLTVQAGAVFMDAEVLKSATPARVGKTLSNFADNSAFVQLKYEIKEGFYVGGAAKYEDEKFAGQPDTAPGLTADGQYSQPVPSYTVFDLFASYRFNKQLDMRLNIGNVTDKDYYLAAYQSGRFLYIGDARNYQLTLNYDF